MDAAEKSSVGLNNKAAWHGNLWHGSTFPCENNALKAGPVLPLVDATPV